MSTQTVSKIKIELPFFDINVSEEDILTKTSELNPYPEKAANGGLYVWTINHPMPNPGTWILYPSTNEVYYVTVPLTYPSEAEIDAPSVYTSKPVDYGDGHGRWMKLTEYVSCLVPTFVRHALHVGADLSKVDAVMQSVEVENQTPKQKFVRLVKLAAELLDEGDFSTAAIAIEYGSHGGQYYDVFDYHTRQLALDVCSSLPKDNPKEYERGVQGYSSLVGDVAHKIDALLQTTIELVTLRVMLANSGPVAKGYIRTYLELIKELRQQVIFDLLLLRNSAGMSYLDHVHTYFFGTGIDL